MSKKRIETIADLTPDSENANEGTQRGHQIIEHSLRNRGAGRSGLAANDGTMIAGISYIYALLDPDTLKIRYIGKSKNPIARLSHHISHCITGKSHSARWIRKLITNNKRPLVQIIEQASDGIIFERERYWIAYYRNTGVNLTNNSDGGEGPLGYKHTKENVQKMRERARSNIEQLKRLHSPESRRKASLARIGRKDSEEVRRNKSISKIGTKASESTKQHLSAAAIKRYQSESGREQRLKYGRSYAKLTDEQVIEMRRLFQETKITHRKIAEMFNTTVSTVSHIRNGKRYMHVK